MDLTEEQRERLQAAFSAHFERYPKTGRVKVNKKIDRECGCCVQVRIGYADDDKGTNYRLWGELTMSPADWEGFKEVLLGGDLNTGHLSASIHDEDVLGAE